MKTRYELILDNHNFDNIEEENCQNVQHIVMRNNKVFWNMDIDTLLTNPNFTVLQKFYKATILTILSYCTKCKHSSRAVKMKWLYAAETFRWMSQQRKENHNKETMIYIP